MKNVIFLDIDGVLNCELHYRSKQFTEYRESLKTIKETREGDKMDYYLSQLCKERIGWLNTLCEETDSVVVISSTWRLGKTVEELREILSAAGATFTILDKTGHTGYERGTEIALWLRDNTDKHFGVPYYDFRNYVIIDDDSDMLLGQKAYFFQTDNYSGLTPTTCYKIKRFLTGKTFYESGN